MRHVVDHAHPLRPHRPIEPAGRTRIACLIVPPHLLKAVAQNHEDPEVRSRALHTLLSNESVRMARVGAAEAATPVSLASWRQRRAMGRLMLQVSAGGVCEPVRSIYDAQNREAFDGPLVREEGDDPTGDSAVDEAYDGLGDTFDLYCDVFARDSLDGRGLGLDALVHFDRDYDNAMWDGRRMIFGDGDGVLFNRFTVALDVIAHELTHGVTQYESNLVYWFQAGALNESLSDVFGSLVKQYKLGQTADQADWLIGQGLFTAAVSGTAIRSMSDPGSAYDDPQLGGKDPQPKDMAGYVRTLEDNGGVHINSGIPNRAFYEAATRMGGYAWEEAGRIWYATMIHPRLSRRATFRSFAIATIRTAARLFGPGSDQHTAVVDGWAAVGIALPAARRRAAAA